MGPQRGSNRSKSFNGAAAHQHGWLFTAVVVFGFFVTVDGQTIAWSAGSPSLVYTYDWTITKSVGSGNAGSGSTAITVSRGSTVDIPYTININRVQAAAPVGMLAFTVTCQGSGGTQPQSVTVADSSSGQQIAQAQVVGNTATFQNVAWSTVPSGPTEAAQGSIVATCTYVAPAPPIPGNPMPVVFSPGNTQEVRGTATLSDVITWPTWSTYFPTGNWLTTPPSTAVTSGSYPNSGTTISGPTVFRYTYTISNTLLCFQGAAINNAATLTAGKAGQDQRTYKAEASATLSVIECDVKPAFTIDQPNLQTSLTYAWSQTLTPLSASSVLIPWGGGSSIPAQATFTRTVTSATFQASFTLTIANPASAPIALSNLQLACPWGGNIMLPCGSQIGGSVGNYGGSNSWLVVPASGSINCMVNMMPIAATWGMDFTQPCTIISSSWLGTQATYTGLVLNFAAPQRWQTINNCALWSVTCSAPVGNAFYVPTVGGLPAGQQVCGNEQSNAPLPPQSFTVAFGGGWVGDGTQPAACASGVTTTCTSQLQLQSTAGTTQNFGGTQTNTLTLQATPTDCPKPDTKWSQVAPQPVLLPAPAPTLNLMTITPVITATVTRTVIRGTFAWAVSSQLTPANQAIAQSSNGILGRYTVTATPQAVAGSDAPVYQLEGVVSVSNPSTIGALRVDEVFVVVDNAAVPLGCSPGLPGILAPNARVDCAFVVNYNQGGKANTLIGRATTVSDFGTLAASEGAAVNFGFESADVSGARGACARVYQTFATNYFDLVQVTGVAPSFDPNEPTTVCSPATWNFDVRFTPKQGAPCGIQKVVQTIGAQFGQDAAGSAQGMSTADFFVTGPSCPQAPAEFVAGSDAVPTLGGSTTAPTSGGSSSGTDSSSSGTSGSSTGSAGAVEQPALDDGATAAPPAGLSVVLSGVQSQKSATPAWQLSVEPADNATLTAGQAGSVSFKVSWSKTKPVTDYTGTTTVINNSPSSAELDGVIINLMDTMGTGDATDEAVADCPGVNSTMLAAVTGENTVTIPANGRLNCSFTLKSSTSGSLVATVTSAAGGDGVVSKGYPVTNLMGDSNCGRVVTGMAASQLGRSGVLLAANGTSEEEVCSASSKVVKIEIPADAKPGTSCVVPVVALAWMKPDNIILSPGALAHARSDVRIAGCSSKPDAATTPAVAGLTLSKGRTSRWVVDTRTDPPVNDTGFEGDTLQVLTTWRQRLEPGLRLNVSGEVTVGGSSAPAKAQVVAIPLCGANSTGCLPVNVPADCKSATSCVFNFTQLPYLPGLVLALTDSGQPAAAVPYDLARARFSGRPAPLCAVLSEERTLEALDGAPEAKTVATGAATPLTAEPFCGPQQSRNYTVKFEGMECGAAYAFNSRATATPVGQAAANVTAEVSFEVTC